MRSRDIIAAIDIGSSKVVALIATMEEDGINIIGVGQCVSSGGVSKGQVVNIDKTTNDILEAINNASMMAGVKYSRLYVGIGDKNIQTVPSQSMISITKTSSDQPLGRRLIKEKDVERVIEQIKLMELSPNDEIFHIIPQGYKVDGEIETNDPIGMTGTKLEGFVRVIMSPSLSVQNIRICINKAHLKNAEYIVKPIASAYATFDENEKEMGTVMLDIGAETTGIAMYDRGNLSYVGILDIGGEFITRDIMYGLSTTRGNAEEFKLNYGCARLDMVDDNEIVEVPGVSGRAPRKISKQEFIQIVEPRVREIIELSYDKIVKEANVPLERMGAGLIITGGTANLPGITELAENIFNLRGRTGNPRDVKGIGENIYDPAFSTAVGLVKYAFSDDLAVEKENRKAVGSYGNWFKNIFDWLKDI